MLILSGITMIVFRSGFSRWYIPVGSWDLGWISIEIRKAMSVAGGRLCIALSICHTIGWPKMLSLTNIPPTSEVLKAAPRVGFSGMIFVWGAMVFLSRGIWIRYALSDEDTFFGSKPNERTLNLMAIGLSGAFIALAVLCYLGILPLI